WGRTWDSLLTELRNEQNGGERFFTYLEALSANAAANLDLLEFLYVCLALGFEGRFRGGEGGRLALTQTRVRLYELITVGRAGGGEALSARWKGAEVRARRVSSGLALWGVASACALVLALLYFGYSVLLGSRSDPVARELAQLKPVP